MTLWTAEKPGRSITTDVPLRTNETAPASAGAVFFALPAAPAVSGISLFVFTRKRAWQQPGPLGCLQIASRTGAARPLGEAAPVFLWLAGSVHRFSVGCDICLMCAQVVRVPVPLSTLLFLPALARRSRSQGRGGWGGRDVVTSNSSAQRGASWPPAQRENPQRASHERRSRATTSPSSPASFHGAKTLARRIRLRGHHAHGSLQLRHLDTRLQRRFPRLRRRLPHQRPGSLGSAACRRMAGDQKMGRANNHEQSPTTASAAQTVGPDRPHQGFTLLRGPGLLQQRFLRVQLHRSSQPR